VRQYVISDEAIQDLNAISDYFLDNNIEAGEQFLLAFSRKCSQLTNFPQIGRSYSYIRQDLRGLALRGFIILYRVSGSSENIKIEILRVVNGRRNLEEIFK
jgi:toxin ParE1/3/4